MRSITRFIAPNDLFPQVSSRVHFKNKVMAPAQLSPVVTNLALKYLLNLSIKLIIYIWIFLDNISKMSSLIGPTIVH